MNIPEYPRIPHLPYKPNASSDDVIEENFNLDEEFEVTEKIDCSNAAIVLDGDNFKCWNRTSFMKKGFHKETPAKMQFANIYNWAHAHKKNFIKLNKMFDDPVVVYGEWCVASHGIYYDNLPSLFMPYEMFLDGNFFLYRNELIVCGFKPVPLLHSGKISYSLLENICNQTSLYSEEKREGVVLKSFDGGITNKRYKMVRSDFVRGKYWNDKSLKKNKLGKG